MMLSIILCHFLQDFTAQELFDLSVSRLHLLGEATLRSLSKLQLDVIAVHLANDQVAKCNWNK